MDDQSAAPAADQTPGSLNGFLWQDRYVVTAGARDFRDDCPAQVCNQVAPKDDPCCLGLLGCEMLPPECVPASGMCLTYICPLLDGTVTHPGLCAP